MATFSATVRRGSTFKFWNVRITPSRAARAGRRGGARSAPHPGPPEGQVVEPGEDVVELAAEAELQRLEAAAELADLGLVDGVLVGVVEAEADQHEGQPTDAAAHEVRHLLPHLVVLAHPDPAGGDQRRPQHQEQGGADLAPAVPVPGEGDGTGIGHADPPKRRERRPRAKPPPASTTAKNTA